MNGCRVELLRHDIESMPDLKVVALLESVQLVVICSTVCVNLGLFVSPQDASHRPFTVHEAAIANNQKLRSAAAWTPKNAGQVLLKLEYVVAPINND